MGHRSAADPTGLADALRNWAPDPVHLTRTVDPWAAAAFAAVIDAPPPPLQPGDPLPPLWHWFTLLEHPAHGELGADGHPARGSFLPPIPHRRRMFAGGRYHQHHPIPVGAELTARSTLADVAVKTGRTGEMAFVTVHNGHRIHYDHPYATGVEGYPGLVIHGPLLALLALELPRRHAPEGTVTAFAYRLVRPAFVPSSIESLGRRAGSAVALQVGVPGCGPSLTATATLS
jgi:hydroxyacyl-ACP dehydratase HTD2-like protein with hotdog domain